MASDALELQVQPQDTVLGARPWLSAGAVHSLSCPTMES